MTFRLPSAVNVYRIPWCSAYDRSRGRRLLRSRTLLSHYITCIGLLVALNVAASVIALGRIWYTDCGASLVSPEDRSVIYMDISIAVVALDGVFLGCRRS